MENKDVDLSANGSVKNAFRFAVLAGAAAVSVWMLTTSLKTVAAAVLSAGLLIFLLKLAAEYILKNSGKGVKKTVGCLTDVFGIVLCFCVCVRFLAPMMLFHPNSDEATQRRLSENAGVSEVAFDGGSGKISGWLINSEEQDAPLIIYYGGNGECSSRRITELLDSGKYEKVFGGYNFAFMDYPSYGNSEGTAGEESFKCFATDVYDYFSDELGFRSIYVFGYSIGTGVANYAASQRPVQGLMLFAPYANGYDLYNNQMNIFYGPLRLCVEYKMNAEEFARSIAVKPLIFASDTDELIPYKSSERLSHAYKAGADFITVSGISHNEFWDNEKVMSALTEYLQGERNK